MSWIGTIKYGEGEGPGNNFPKRNTVGTLGGNNITDWEDPLVPELDDCKYACGGSGFFSGEDAKDATRWDGLMLYLGKLRNTNSFWRQILLSDTVLESWLKDNTVRNALSALLYSECYPGGAPAATYIQICDGAAGAAAAAAAAAAGAGANPAAVAAAAYAAAIQAQPLNFLCEFFKEVPNILIRSVVLPR